MASLGVVKLYITTATLQDHFCKLRLCWDTKFVVQGNSLTWSCGGEGYLLDSLPGNAHVYMQIQAIMHVVRLPQITL